jgi:hypothetical protein
VSEHYARHFGHDPEGNWILVVHEDNTSEIFRFENPDEMWCCRKDRDQYYRAAKQARFAPAFESPGK